MPTLDDFFRAETEQPHPRLRAWIRRIENGETATLEVFRPRGEFGSGKPVMFVHFHAGEHPTETDEVPWDDDLNAGLIQRGVRAVDDQNEAERFSLGLRAAMKKAEREFGDGFFNAMLVDLIRESDLSHHPEIAEVLQYSYANTPHPEGGAFDRYPVCRGFITEAIRWRANELTQHLMYTRQEAERILVSAIARYLDERFSVSRRREYGLL